MKRKKQTRFYRCYTIMDEIMASPTVPLAQEKRRHQLSVMYQGLRAIETTPAPTRADWRACSDAVNLMETLVDLNVVEDNSGLLAEAVTALAKAGERPSGIRLDGTGIQAVRAVLEDYAQVLDAVPARTMVRAHRRTEFRLQQIIEEGKRKPHDVTVRSASVL